MIFRFIFRRIDDEQITADLTSQTFFTALRNLKKYKNLGVPFSAWLYRIATNEVNRYYQNSKRNLVLSLEEPIFQEMIAHSVEVESEGISERILRILNSMCDSDIEVIELRFFESKSFSEMAYILDISEASAKMRTYRAMDKLKVLIKEGNHDKV